MIEAVIAAAVLLGFCLGWWRRTVKANREAAALSDALGAELGDEKKANEEAVEMIGAHVELLKGLTAAAFPEGHGSVPPERLLQRVAHLGTHFYRAVKRDKEKLLAKAQKTKRKKSQSRKDRKKSRRAA